MLPRAAIAVLVGCSTVLLAACAGREDRLGGAPPDAGHHATSAPSSPAPDERSGSGAPAWPSATESRPSPPRCSDVYGDYACYAPGLPCDVVEGTPCCGSCVGGTCCAAKGQPCNPDMGGCCGGLRCGADCTCE